MSMAINPKNILALVVISFVFLLLNPCAAQQSVSITQKWSGKIADASLRSFDKRVVQDNATWNKLWASWRPGKKVADVDFSKQIVLVETVDGPNNILTSSLKVDATGELKYEIAGTEMAGSGFGYLLMSIPADNIKRVNGRAIRGAEEPSTGKSGSDVAMRNDGTPIASPVGSGDSKAGEANRAQPVELIKVDITGVVRTGMNAIGGETTGNLIAANGVVWELEMTDEQVNMAGKIGNSMVTVTGTLRKIRGVEVRERYIVTVNGLARAGGGAAGRTKGPLVPRDSGTSRRSNQRARSDQVQMPGRETARQEEAARQGSADDLAGFESIVIKITGGIVGKEQRQTIAADGKVDYESKSQNISNSWRIKPENLALLHKYIADTDWDAVPPVTRAVTSPDAYKYEILISTETGKKRFFIDGPSVSKQPVIKQLFQYLRKPN